MDISVMKGAVLLPYQQRWVADKSQVKIIEKGRRIGLSFGEASDSVLHAASTEGANVYYIAYAKDMTEGFIADCAKWAKAFQAAASQIEETVIEAGEDKGITIFSIRFDSGNKIQAFSSAPRNLRSKGRPGERLIIDEAAFVDNLKELLKAAMAMTMWGGSVRIISTHNGADNPFNELVEDVRAGKYDYSLHRVTLDDAIEDGLFKRICEITGQTWSLAAERDWRQTLINRYKPNEQEELFCVPSMGGGSWLTRALIESRMVAKPLVRFYGSEDFNLMPERLRALEMQDWIDEHVAPLLKQLNPKRKHALGEDFGRSSDMTNMTPMEVGETLHRRVPFMVELHNVPHKQQEQVLFAICDGLPNFMGAEMDAGGNGSYLAEVAGDRYGSKILQTQLSEKWYREHMPRYKAALEDGLLTLLKHEDVLEDHRAVKVIRGVPRLPKGKTDKSGERHGDSAISGVMAYNATLIETGPVRVASANQRRSRNMMRGYPWQ